MNRKADHFAHGFGAIMRWAAVARYKLIIAGGPPLIGILFAEAVTLFEHAAIVGSLAGVAAAFVWYSPIATIGERIVGERGKTMMTGFVYRFFVVASCAVTGALAISALTWFGSRAPIVGALVGIVVAVFLFPHVFELGNEIIGVRLIRGAEIKSENELAAASMRWSTDKGESGPFAYIGGVPIPHQLETRNFLVAGTMGGGKTTALRQLLDAADQRGECVIVHDPSGDLVKAYYRPERGDAILNTYDARASEWDLFADIQTRADAQVIAECIAQPKPREQVTEWLGYLREYIADAAWVLRGDGRGTVENLLRTLGYASPENLARLVDDTPSRRFFVKGAERAAASVIFGLPYVLRVLTTLRYRPGVGGTFAWTRFVANIDGANKQKPWVFLGAPSRQFLLLRPLITAALDVASTHMLSLEPNHPTRRVWLVIDEFATLPPMDSIRTIASQGRKYGTALVLGIQDPGQLVEVYDRAASTLAGYANTQLFLRLPGGPAARWACELLGKQEVERRMENDTYDTEDSHARSSVSVTREVRDLVLDSEIAGLHDLHGYLRVPNVGIGSVVIPTEHLSRPCGPAIEPVDQSELWLAHLPGLRVAEGEVTGVPSDIADRPIDPTDFAF